MESLLKWKWLHKATRSVLLNQIFIFIFNFSVNISILIQTRNSRSRDLALRKNWNGMSMFEFDLRFWKFERNKKNKIEWTKWMREELQLCRFYLCDKKVSDVIAMDTSLINRCFVFMDLHTAKFNLIWWFDFRFELIFTSARYALKIPLT